MTTIYTPAGRRLITWSVVALVGLLAFGCVFSGAWQQ